MFEESYFHSAFLRVFKPTGEMVYCTADEIEYATLEDAMAEGPRLREIYPDCLILLDYGMMRAPHDEENMDDYQEVWSDEKQCFRWIGKH